MDDALVLLAVCGALALRGLVLAVLTLTREKQPMDDDSDDAPCSHVWEDVDSDGRQRCSECGEVMPRHLDPADCLDCGQCEDCVERSIAAAEEADDGQEWEMGDPGA